MDEKGFMQVDPFFVVLLLEECFRNRGWKECRFLTYSKSMLIVIVVTFILPISFFGINFAL